MILHPHYRTTLTQIDAISFAIDQMRTYAPESRQQTRAIAALEQRLAVLRSRRDRNRAARKNPPVMTAVLRPDQLPKGGVYAVGDYEAQGVRFP